MKKVKNRKNFFDTFKWISKESETTFFGAKSKLKLLSAYTALKLTRTKQHKSNPSALGIFKFVSYSICSLNFFQMHEKQTLTTVSVSKYCVKISPLSKKWASFYPVYDLYETCTLEQGIKFCLSLYAGWVVNLFSALSKQVGQGNSNLTKIYIKFCNDKLKFEYTCDEDYYTF